MPTIFFAVCTTFSAADIPTLEYAIAAAILPTFLATNDAAYATTICSTDKNSLRTAVSAADCATFLSTIRATE